MEIKEKIKKANESKNLVVGLSSVKRGVMGNKLSEVILASNCPVDAKRMLVSYSEELGNPVHILDIDSVELGILCKMNFKVCVVGIKR